MKFCKDCKHSAPNTWEWSSEPFQQRYRICTISTADPVNGVSECASERGRLHLFSKRCGPSARYFQASEGAKDE